MNSKIIATDFDDTLCENKWPEIGEPINKVIDYLKAEKANGAKLILWTCRAGEKLTDAVDWCKKQGLDFDAVNENVPEIIEAFGGDTRKIFANEYIDDKNVKLSDIFEGDANENSMSSWAAREVELAIESEKKAAGDTNDWEYGAGCYNSALKAYNTLCKDGHSNFSIQATKSILNRLIDGRCLTPIEDVEDVWNEISDRDGVKQYQCRRMSSLFKKVDNNGNVTFHDFDRTVLFDTITKTSWHNNMADQLVDKLFPITMPYLPPFKRYRVNCEEFLVDPKNGDYDTVAYLDILTPDGKKIELNRYFKDEDNHMVQIDKEEFDSRKAKWEEQK